MFSSLAQNLVPGGTILGPIFLRERRLDAASWRNYGVGHPGTNGVPTLTGIGAPVVNHDFSLSVDPGASDGISFTPGVGLVLGY